MFSQMLFMFFFFVGIVAMLWHLQRRLDAQFNSLAEEGARMRVLLRSLEAKIDHLASNASSQGSHDGYSDFEMNEPDPLLNLNFDAPGRGGDSRANSLEINFNS